MSDNTVYFSSASGDEVQCDKRQAYRFMGCRDDGNAELDNLYRECAELLKKEASFKAVWRKSAVSFKGDDTVCFDFGEIKSAFLCKNLEGCTSAYVFAATTGVDVDRLILRLSRISPSKAVITDATGSAAIEDFCDILNGRLKEEAECKPRFSCGYGDFSIENQKNILEFLNAYKLLGISLSESFLMTPKKSVTAIVGIKG